MLWAVASVEAPVNKSPIPMQQTRTGENLDAGFFVFDLPALIFSTCFGNDFGAYKIVFIPQCGQAIVWPVVKFPALPVGSSCPESNSIPLSQYWQRQVTYFSAIIPSHRKWKHGVFTLLAANLPLFFRHQRQKSKTGFKASASFIFAAWHVLMPESKNRHFKF